MIAKIQVSYLAREFSDYSEALRVAREDTRQTGRTFCVRKLFESKPDAAIYIACPLHDPGYSALGSLVGIATKILDEESE